MFVRNYYNKMGRLYFSDAVKTGEYGDGALCIKAPNGSIATGGLNIGDCSVKPEHAGGGVASSGIGFQFGSGETPVTYDDYALESIFGSTVIPKASGSSNIFQSDLTYDSQTRTYSRTYTMNVTNVSVDDIAIKEVGIFTAGIMIFRDVLPTPVPVASGETIKFTYTVNFSMPEVS